MRRTVIAIVLFVVVYAVLAVAWHPGEDTLVVALIATVITVKVMDRRSTMRGEANE